ncbi:hypothetical protein ACFE04_006160 [Oxalis oulophora]
MEHDRLNSPATSGINLQVLGHQLHFAQDPNSKHHGTTVWDSSLVLVKYLEKNCRKGRFCPSKLKGKRVIELGAGCGAAGFGMALLGCDVVSTDQKEVLPLLARNVERNSSTIMQTNPEHLLEPLLQTISALSGPKTTIMIGHEIRSTSVHEQMLDMWKRNFEVKIIPKNKHFCKLQIWVVITWYILQHQAMDAKYQHPSIQLYIMGAKPAGGSIEKSTQSIGQQIGQVGDRESSKSDSSTSDVACTENENAVLQEAEEDSILKKISNGKKLSDWEARRYGSLAARLLRDVKIT